MRFFTIGVYLLLLFTLRFTLTAGVIGCESTYENRGNLIAETGSCEITTTRSNNATAVDLTSWLEERGNNATRILSPENFKVLSDRIKIFNARKDGIRLYTIAINDLQLKYKATLSPSLFENGFQFRKLENQGLKEESNRTYIAMLTEVGKAMRQVQTELKNAGYPKAIVYFYGHLTVYDNNGPHNFHTNMMLSGIDNWATISKRVKGLTSQNSIFDVVNNIINSVESIVDGVTDPELSHVAENANVNSWYNHVGNKTSENFSLTSARRLFDYTGLFYASNITEKLSDETAKIIITDSDTKEEVITSIQTIFKGTALPFNVYWLHINRKGIIKTQLFYSDSFLQQIKEDGTINGNVPGQLEKYIGEMYKKGAPQFMTISQIIDFFNFEGKFLKIVSGLFEKVKIDARWWDSHSPEYAFAGIQKIMPDGFLSPLQNSFAFVCGVWNGLIGNVQFVLGILNALTEARSTCLKLLLDADYREKFSTDLGNLTELVQKNWTTILSLGKEMVIAKVSSEWSKVKTGDLTSVYYLAGNVAVEIAIAILTAGIVDAAKAALYSVKGVQYIFDLLKYPIQIIEKFGAAFISSVAWLLKQGFEFAYEAAGFVIKKGSDVLFTLAEESGKFIVKGVRWIDNIEIDFSFPTYEMRFGEAWAMAIEGGGYESLGGKVLQIVKTKDGKFGLRRATTIASEHLDDAGRFIDKELESDYAKYLARKAKDGATARERLEWKEARDYWLNDSPLARGNKFNRKAWDEKWYPFWEVYLENGKFVDGYNPLTKEIISRKATDLSDIKIETFEAYLKEMKVKYASGLKIKSQKEGYQILFDKPLEGKQILEIPSFNETLSDIRQYSDLAKRYNIEIRFRPE